MTDNILDPRYRVLFNSLSPLALTWCLWGQQRCASSIILVGLHTASYICTACLNRDCRVVFTVKLSWYAWKFIPIKSSTATISTSSFQVLRKVSSTPEAQFRQWWKPRAPLEFASRAMKKNNLFYQKKFLEMKMITKTDWLAIIIKIVDFT